MALVRSRLEAARVPRARRGASIVLATWNVRELGRTRRRDDAIAMLAAIVRRFSVTSLVELRRDTGDLERILRGGLPTEEIATRVMRGRLALLDTSDIQWHAAAMAAEGLSHAEIAMACEQAAKNAILDHTTAVSDAELAAALMERRSTHA